jgi:hypothetical protein
MLHESEQKRFAIPHAARRLLSEARQLQLGWGMGVVLFVSAIGISLALQGWRSRIPAFDMLTYFYSAQNLLARGALPQYGDVSSYGSFSPPGTAWLMAPGMLTLADPRLFEKVGSAGLYFGTLLGVLLLVRGTFGTWSAYLSVLLYGLSGLGLSMAGSLWPIGHPFFYVWMVYFASQWVARSDAKYLGAAIATWVVGMYDDMAIAPAVFILPALWLFYRPPLFSRLLFVAGALSLAVWYPYLQFEAGRGFADLRSQVQRQSIFPANYKDTWCDASLTPQKWQDTSGPPLSDSTIMQTEQSQTPGLLRRLLVRAGVVVDGLLSNFREVTPIPGASVALLLMGLSSLAVLSVSGFSTRGVGLMIRHSLTRGRLAAIINRLAPPAEADIQAVERTKKVGVLVLGLLVPWLILLLVAEPGRPERFLWLWPLQVVVLAAFVADVLARLKAPRTAALISQIALICILLAPPLLSGLDAWRRIGWAGSDPEEIQVVDYVANQVRLEGKDRAAIGYQTFIYSFMPKYNIIDPHYKVGAEFDLLFEYRASISNTNHCAEGISPADEYRIVQIAPKANPAAEREYFNVALDGSFQMLGQVGSYQVFKRSKVSAVAP